MRCFVVALLILISSNFREIAYAEDQAEEQLLKVCNEASKTNALLLFSSEICWLSKTFQRLSGSDHVSISGTPTNGLKISLEISNSNQLSIDQKESLVRTWVKVGDLIFVAKKIHTTAFGSTFVSLISDAKLISENQKISTIQTFDQYLSNLKRELESLAQKIENIMGISEEMTACTSSLNIPVRIQTFGSEVHFRYYPQLYWDEINNTQKQVLARFKELLTSCNNVAEQIKVTLGSNFKSDLDLPATLLFSRVRIDEFLYLEATNKTLLFSNRIRNRDVAKLALLGDASSIHAITFLLNTALHKFIKSQETLTENEKKELIFLISGQIAILSSTFGLMGTENIATPYVLYLDSTKILVEIAKELGCQTNVMICLTDENYKSVIIEKFQQSLIEEKTIKSEIETLLERSELFAAISGNPIPALTGQPLTSSSKHLKLCSNVGNISCAEWLMIAIYKEYAGCGKEFLELARKWSTRKSDFANLILAYHHKRGLCGEIPLDQEDAISYAERIRYRPTRIMALSYVKGTSLSPEAQGVIKDLALEFAKGFFSALGGRFGRHLLK